MGKIIMNAATVYNPADFKNKRILITGGMGFIGSRVAHRLAKLGARITILDLMYPKSGANRFNLADIEEQVEVVIGDMCDSELVAAQVEQQDYIFNLAAHSGHLASLREPLLDNRQNAQAAVVLLEACRMHNPDVKVVYTSTRQIYGRPQYFPVDEKHPLKPVDYNGVSKMAAELYHQICGRIYGLRSVVVRLSNVFGPGMRVKDDRQTFIGWWFRQLCEGRELVVFGNGQQTRDLNYVDDVVDALLRCAQLSSADGEVYNLGSGQPIRLWDLAQLMISIYGSGRCRLAPFPKKRKSIDIGDYFANIDKISTDLGWKPVTSLPAGIEQTLAFYQSHREHYW